MITIQNKIEVISGNKIMVPGCEPTSAFTSPTLAENRVCLASVVSLADALAAIPGSTVIYTSNPRRKWFVLPSGPPPTPQKCAGQCRVEDWYQVLRSLGQTTQVDTTLRTGNPPLSVGQICSAFPLRGVF